MQLKTRTWCLLSLLLLVAAGYFWWLGDQRRAALPVAAPAAGKTNASKPGASANPFFQKPGGASARGGAHAGAIELLPPPADARFPWRLSNAAKQGEELFRSDTAVLLRNAHLDTAVGTQLAIPAHLRAGERPGSYVAQARGALDSTFREQLREVGATIVSYIPNNAYLVQATPEAARRLALMPRTQSVVPFEPYFKISPEVILAAVEQRPLPAGMLLNVITFPGEPLASARALTRLGAEIVSEQPSPFGHLFTVRPAANSLVALAVSPVVQEIEVSHRRMLLTDLARPRMGIATNSIVANYLGRNGNNVNVTVAGSGVQQAHPAFGGRFINNAASSLTDTNGHDTHVAGIIAGGVQVSAIASAFGSVAGADFRGMAQAATLYPLSVLGGLTDYQLQTNSAVMNSYIFNGSFGYSVSTYDAAAVSYDVAVRDSFANRTNDQPITYVFAAGNNGAGNGGGSGGVPDSILSPATGKNVISVGSIENFRLVSGITPGGSNLNVFLPDTDSPDQVAQTSSRGNVGIGTEGTFGRYKPDVVAPGTFLVSAKASTFTGTNSVVTSVDPSLGSLAPNYRYESGTSMAAGVISGMLALMQEHFRVVFGVTNSPALNKALLINGARPSSLFYNLQVQNQINYGGWGLPHLTNTLPFNAVSSLVKFKDQSTNNSLATGDIHQWSLAALPTNSALRVTLVWTDPPGNPVAGPKLVNDLDLVVSNKTNGKIYEGNNIKGGSFFTDASTPGTPAVSDIVNNVENVFIPGFIGTDYDIYVVGKRINVNAVTAKTNGIVQDYALVVSVEVPANFTLSAAPTLLTTNRPALSLTNGFPVLKQRVGANYPLFTGSTNGQVGQWNFYVFTNTYVPAFTNVVTNVVAGFTNISTNIVNAPLVNGTNVAISTFLPPNLALSRIRGADIDLYVARGAGADQLTNLAPAVVSAAAKSRNRGGTEQVILGNAGVGEVFYIGVKAEDQQGGEFGLAVISTDKSFAATNAAGQYVIQFFPVPQDIPDGAPEQPEGLLLFGIMPFSTNLTSFVITNVISHENHGDLVGTLFHNNEYVVLNNHSVNPTAPGGLYTATNIFDDYQNPPDGPGSAFTWAGQDAVGLWLLTVVDSALEHTGTVLSATLAINPRTNAVVGGTNLLTLRSNQCTVQTVTVPLSATSMVVNVTFTSGDIDLLGKLGSVPTYQTNNYDFAAFGQLASFKFTNNVLSVPPLSPGGTYFLMFCNNGATNITLAVSYDFYYDFTTGGTRNYAQTTAMPLLDNYTTNNVITNSDNRVITGVDVGVRIDHPRASDLVLHLTSPSGTRVLLYENRAGWTTNYYGGPPGVATGLYGTNLYANFTENTNYTTVLVTNVNPTRYSDTGALLPIKFIPAPLTNFISPPLFVNSNAFNGAPYGFNRDEQALGAVIQGSALFIAGMVKTNATATNDGMLLAYALPITNKNFPAATNLWATNWPHIAARNSNMLFAAVASTREGVYGVGHTFDYFPAVPPSAGGFLPDVYDFDMGCTNGTLTITYDFYSVPDQMTIYYQGTNLLNTGVTNNLTGPRTTNLVFSGNSSFVRIYMNEFSGIPGTAWTYTPSVTPGGPVAPKRKGVVVKYGTTGPSATPTTATSGALWLSRALTNNAFGFVGEDRFQAAVGTLENGTNDFIYATGSAEIAAGKEGFVLAKFRTNGAGVWMATDAAFSAVGAQTCRGMAITHVDNTNIIVAGFTNLVGFGDYGQLWCYTTAGALRWRVRAAALGTYNGVTVLGTNIYAVGTDAPGLAGNCLVEKYDLNGNFIARRTYNLVAGSGDALFSALGLGCSDRLYAVGMQTNSATDVRGVLLELDPALPAAPLSITTIIHNANQFNVASAVTTDGNDLYVSGHTKSSSVGPLDTFVYRYRVKNWYQPEESLNAFIGERSTGNWQLEVWDNRAGAQLAANQLNCWDLNFGYAPVGTVAAPLFPATNSAPVLLSGQAQYFIVNVPVGITRATNVLSGTGNLRLVFNQFGIPVSGAAGNVVILSGTNGGTAVLDTTSTFPLLQPGLRYYLSVEPVDDTATGSYTVRVDYDQAVAPSDPTPALASGIVTSGTLAAGTGVNYYQFNVADTVSGTLFELFPTGGNVDLYVRKAIGAFPPATFLNQFSYDYGSRNLGAASEQILLVTNAAAPIPLTSGTWYLAVGNSDSKTVSYNVRATAFTGQPYSIVPLANGVPAAGVSSPGNAPNSLFKLTVSATNKALLFEVSNLNGTGGDLILRRGGFPVYAGPGQGYDFGSFAAGGALERVVVRTNAGLPDLSGDWYLGVLNSQPTHLSYSVLARYPTNGILVSSAPLVVAAPPALSSTNLATRSFGFDLGGLPGERYQVQYASNLAGVWLVLTNIVAPANGSITFLHTGALTNRNLYYRIQQVP